jgi:hypothetical protein
MKSILRVSVAAIALIAVVPFASAQTTVIERVEPRVVELSPAQRTVIYRHVRARPVAVAPQVELRVGAPVPTAVELQAFPDEVYVEVPTLRRYRYFNVHNQVVLVDPATSEIVEIIRE